MNGKSSLWILAAGLLLLGGAGAGKAVPPVPPKVDPAAVPPRPYYPPGYRDLRLAAAAEIATFPRPRNLMLMHGYPDEKRLHYDVIDCNAESLDGKKVDPVARRYGGLAYDVARMRAELKQLGYVPSVYDQPLLDYERAMLAKPRSRGDVDAEEAYDDAPSTKLARQMDARRARLQPAKPKIVAEGGCGGGEAPFRIRFSPPGGHLWLIDGFAFRVCERRVRDPWDHRACGWTEYQADDTATVSGRYIYEARWPDGTVRRGARILEGDPGSEKATPVTFRKD
ncbi:MAG TPA: hypothetical protein VH331_06285 [Allosphingosinicella sp.]|jgi:hypothetical protein|nr:hypothetical protein [Allosphingosinicella sp.]